MLGIFGILGLLQTTVLPALILMKIWKLKGGLTEKILRLFPISLIANYLVIFLLAALHIYIRPAVFILIGAEISGILWLYRKTLLTPLGETFSGITKAVCLEFEPLGDLFHEKNPDRKTLLKNWIWIISGCFAISGVLWAFHLCRLNIGTVFSGWDTLFSWNRYAVTWAGGSVPEIGGMYPQLIPANWSLSYLLQGSEAVQFFNTLLPPLFFLLIQGMLFDLGFQRRESAFFFAAVIARYMMKKLMGDQLFDGYMDVPAGAMSLLSFYTFLKAENKSADDQKQAVILGTIFAAGAVITKQSGFPALLTAPLSIFLLLRAGLSRMSRKQKIMLTGAVILIVLPWYLHCMLYNTRGYERELIADGIVAYNQKYSLHYRLDLALKTLGRYKYCFLLGFLGLPFVPKRYRLPLSLLVWPLTILWAVSYSYDARNLGPVLPFTALLCGLALSGILEKVMDLLGKLRVGRISLAVLAGLAAAASAVLLIRFLPDTRLKEDQRIKQKALFGERLNNELLYGVFGESHSGYDIYTDYPAYFLSGYEECCSAAELTDTAQVRGVLEEDGINWMLLPVVMPNDTDPSKALIEKCIADGKCEQIRCSDGYYKAYCLYQIHR